MLVIEEIADVQQDFSQSEKTREQQLAEIRDISKKDFEETLRSYDVTILEDQEEVIDYTEGFDYVTPLERRMGRKFTSEEIISFGKNPEQLEKYVLTKEPRIPNYSELYQISDEELQEIKDRSNLNV